MAMTSPWNKPGPPRSRKEEYRQEYDAAKVGGKPFFPHTVFKDAVVSLVVVAVIVVLASWRGTPTEPIADPTSTTYNPRPDWYFLFLFEMLKFFPGYLEGIVATVIPGIAVLLLLLLPFIDRRRGRHPLDRPVVTALSLVAIGVIAFLTIRGATAPLVSPGEPESPAVAEGRRFYVELNCSYCHPINGVGGAVGPDLGVASRGLSKETIEQYLSNPHAMVPRSLHPKLQFTPEEIDALSAYIANLGAVPQYSEEAPMLFEQHCAVCHTTDGSGGRAGPDLSRVGAFRNQAYLTMFISDPQAVFPGATMPSFEERLTEAQISDLAAYLASFRGQPAPTPTTTPAPSPTQTVAPTTPAGEVSYSADIQPLFDQYCNTCHGASALGGLNMSNYESLMTTGQHRPVVVPGNASGSILYQVLIDAAPGILPMPPGNRLSAGQIGLVEAWINQGALDD